MKRVKEIFLVVQVICRHCNKVVREENNSSLKASSVKYTTCKNCKVHDDVVEYELRKAGLL